jgi:RNA polymerase sigma-70 factor (ECF subfamily)
MFETVPNFVVVDHPGTNALSNTYISRAYSRFSCEIMKPASPNEDVVALIPALRAFARSLCQDSDAADDLVQETLVKAIADLDEFQPDTRLKSWLFTIMRNTSCTRIKVTTREAPEGWIPIQRRAAESQEWAPRGGEAARAIDLLPDEQREAIVTVRRNGISYQEAAENGYRKVGTIKSRLSRSRAKLAVELGDDADAVIRLSK